MSMRKSHNGLISRTFPDVKLSQITVAISLLRFVIVVWYLKRYLIRFQSSTSLGVNDVNSAIRPFKHLLSYDDQCLFRYAEELVCSLDMSDTELFISFCHRDPIAIKPYCNTRPTNRLVVTYDRNGYVTYFWERRSFWRKAKSFLASGIRRIGQALKAVLPIAGGIAMKAIGF